MKHVEVIGTTTHRDRTGEKLTLQDLERFVEHAQNMLVPIFNQHDHALPPIGRQVGHEIRVMDCGEHAIYAIWEVWEPGDEHPGPDPDGREVLIRSYASGQAIISIDASFEGAEFRNELTSLQQLGFEIHGERRKALDASSVIIIGVGLVAAEILKELGKDCYSALKGWLSKVRTEHPDKGKRVVFSLTLRGERELEVNVILDEPSPEVIEQLFDRGFAAIQGQVKALAPETARAAFRGDNEEYSLEYTVDKDGFPSRIEPVNLESFGGVSINYAGQLTPIEEPITDISIQKLESKE